MRCNYYANKLTNERSCVIIYKKANGAYYGNQKT